MLSITNYIQQGHPHFDAPWNFLVAFKDEKSRANWYKSSAQIEIEIHCQTHHRKIRVAWSTASNQYLGKGVS